MIISERHLFKGLIDESPETNDDSLFHMGHAFAVSVTIGLMAMLVIGIFAAVQ